MTSSWHTSRKVELLNLILHFSWRKVLQCRGTTLSATWYCACRQKVINVDAPFVDVVSSVLIDPIACRASWNWKKKNRDCQNPSHEMKIIVFYLSTLLKESSIFFLFSGIRLVLLYSSFRLFGSRISLSYEALSLCEHSFS